MNAHIYKQTSDILHKMTVHADMQYAKYECAECQGTGVFGVYEDEWTCVDCKGSGFHWINLI